MRNTSRPTGVLLTEVGEPRDGPTSGALVGCEGANVSNRRRRPLKLYTCAWCSARKPIEEMRHPQSQKGKAPSTCHACRVSHPGLSWCDFHGEPHEVARFVAYEPPRPGYWNICREAFAHKRSRRQGHAGWSCPACRRQRDSWEFRGGRSKASACRTCEGENPGKRWCVGCEGWLGVEQFNRTGVDKRFMSTRCRPCRAAYNHGTTVAEILRVQGATQPECAACGSMSDLKVDHDHNCCPAAQSSGCCIRGYLCHECNTAEGLLKTPDRALALAAYMQRVAQREGKPDLAAIA